MMTKYVTNYGNKNNLVLVQGMNLVITVAVKVTRLENFCLVANKVTALAMKIR